MAKLIVAFVALAAVAILVLNMGGHVDMGGEHAAQETMKGETHAPASADASKAPAPKN